MNADHARMVQSNKADDCFMNFKPSGHFQIFFVLLIGVHLGLSASNSILKGKSMALNKDLLEILACPKCVRDPGCTGELEYREAQNQLVCHHCKLIYRIEDDIPIMLIDEALPLENK